MARITDEEFVATCLRPVITRTQDIREKLEKRIALETNEMNGIDPDERDAETSIAYHEGLLKAYRDALTLCT